MPYKDPEKQKAAQRMWYERNRESIIDSVKERQRKLRAYVLQYKLDNSICNDCGISYPPHILDFDHLYDKRFKISNAHKSKGIDTVIEEIAKCEIVCANCHRHRTWMRSTA